MRNLMILTVFYGFFVLNGFAQVIRTNEYSIEKKTIENLINLSKFEELSIVSENKEKGLFLIACWDYNEYPINYFVIDTKRNMAFNQPIPKNHNGRWVNVSAARLNVSGDSVEFHAGGTGGFYMVKRKMTFK